VDECLAMATHKTGALIGCAGALGAILGGAGEAEVTALRAFGRHLGVAFQALDDILGIWGDPALTGKPAASDLRLGKKTLPLAQALTQGGRAAAALRSLWEAGPNPSSVAKAMAGLEEAKSRAWTTHVAERSLAAAMACLDEGSLRPEAVADLRAIAEFVTRRDH